MKKFTLLTILMLNLSVVYSQNYRESLEIIKSNYLACSNNIEEKISYDYISIESQYKEQVLCDEFYNIKLDSLLNVVYYSVRKGMSIREKQRIKEIQIEWIKDRDKAIDKNEFILDRINGLLDFKDATLNKKTSKYVTKKENGNILIIFRSDAYLEEIKKYNNNILVEQTSFGGTYLSLRRWESFYKNGKVKEFKRYYNGKLNAEGSFDKEGLKHDYWSDYLEKGNYINGVKIGEWAYEIGKIVNYSIPIFKNSYECGTIDTIIMDSLITINYKAETKVLSYSTGDLNNDGVDDIALLTETSYNKHKKDYSIGVFFGQIGNSSLYLKDTEARGLNSEFDSGGYYSKYYKINIENKKLVIHTDLTNTFSPDEDGVIHQYYYSFTYTFGYENNEFIMNTFDSKKIDKILFIKDINLFMPPK